MSTIRATGYNRLANRELGGGGFNVRVTRPSKPWRSPYNHTTRIGACGDAVES